MQLFWLLTPGFWILIFSVLLPPVRPENRYRYRDRYRPERGTDTPFLPFKNCTEFKKGCLSPSLQIAIQIETVVESVPDSKSPVRDEPDYLFACLFLIRVDPYYYP